MSCNPTKEIEYRDRLKLDQQRWYPLWNACASFCCPDRRQVITNAITTVDKNYTPTPSVENSVAVDSVSVLAGGCKQWIIGPDWFQFEPHPALSLDMEVKDWLADCTDRAQGPISDSGFYTAGHEMFRDDGVFGTAGLSLLDGEEKLIRCQSYAPSEFVFETNWDGAVSRLITTWTKTARELSDTFGDKIPASVKRDIAQNKGNEKHEVIHTIYRREGVLNPDYPGDPKGMKFASCWIHVATKMMMGDESGYDEMPFVAPRWEKWSNDSVYGVSPAMMALAAIKGVNVIDMILVVLGEVQLNPRIKRTANQAGPIDLSPGGISTSGGDEDLKEWLTGGRFDVGINLLDKKEQQIRRLFHAPLFESLIGVDRQITMYEAQLREQQAANRIAPAMSRFETDFVNPVLRRFFMMLYRAGVFAPPPPGAFTRDAAGRPYLLFPKVVQTNRMAQVLNSKKSFAFQSAMNRIIPLAQAGQPQVLDMYNWDGILRDLDRGDGMPLHWHLDEKQVADLRAARAQAQQQSLMQEAALKAMSSKPTEVAGLAQQLAAGGEA